MISGNYHHDPYNNRYKDKQLIIARIRRMVETGSGLSISELKKEHSEEAFFYESLRYVTTTKKALCVALDIPLEGGCRYKRGFEKSGMLWEVKQIYCPFTKHLAWTLTTDPEQAPKPDNPKPGDSAQLSLF